MREVKWHTAESSTGNSVLAQHAFANKEIKHRFGNYIAAKSLCNQIGISEDGESFLNLSEIPAEEFSPTRACKNCIKSYKNL